MSISSPEPKPEPKSIAELDYLTIRAEMGPSSVQYPTKVIAQKMGIGRRRVRNAMHWGKNNDASINIINAMSSNKQHPSGEGPMNALGFTDVPTLRMLEGLLFDLKYIRTRATTASKQHRTAQKTTPDPMAQRLWEINADSLEVQMVASCNSAIANVELLIAHLKGGGSS